MVPHLKIEEAASDRWRGSIHRRQPWNGESAPRRSVLGLDRADAEEPGARSRRTKALVFDTFGTVVDWRGSITGRRPDLEKPRVITVDWGRLADRWRGWRAFQKVRVKCSWTNLDHLHSWRCRRFLCSEFLTSKGSPRRKRSLEPSSASLEAVARSSVMSRASRTLVHDRAPCRTATSTYSPTWRSTPGIPWDLILSAELAMVLGKPDREVYTASRAVGATGPEEVMMCAAHSSGVEGRPRFRVAYRIHSSSPRVRTCGQGR